MPAKAAPRKMIPALMLLAFLASGVSVGHAQQAETAPADGEVGATFGGGPWSGNPALESRAPTERSSESTPIIPAPGPGMMNSFAAGAEGAPNLEFTGLSDQPVVVELFTSQGCSSCPPADEMLNDLADMPDVLVLSLHVDYWDYLGWADSFARPEFTNRQERYARAAGERAVYTPQVIVQGQDTAVSLRPNDLLALVDARRAAPAMLNVDSVQDGDKTRIEIYPLSNLGQNVAVSLVRYAPRREVEVTAGENRGRRIAYRNIVLDIQRLAVWNGVDPLRMTISAGDQEQADLPADTRSAILVQQLGGGKGNLPGPILAALRLD